MLIHTVTQFCYGAVNRVPVGVAETLKRWFADLVFCKLIFTGILQCYVSFYCTAKWITHLLFLEDFFPIQVATERWVGSPEQILISYLPYTVPTVYTYVNPNLPIHPAPINWVLKNELLLVKRRNGAQKGSIEWA